MQIVQGRVNPGNVLDEVLPTRVGATMVSVCGPGALADEVRAAVRERIELANLELTSEEESQMPRDLNAILGHIAQLNELDTTNVPPMAQVSEMLAGIADLTGVSLRRDAVRPSLDRTLVMAAAPESDGRFFKVPKVIER